MRGLGCCTRACSSCGVRGLLLTVVRRSRCRGCSCYRAPALGRVGFRGCSPWAQELWLPALEHRLVVVVHGLSCSRPWRIFPDQGWNPCPLHWQADSSPPSHWGSLGISSLLRSRSSSLSLCHFSGLVFLCQEDGELCESVSVSALPFLQERWWNAQNSGSGMVRHHVLWTLSTVLRFFSFGELIPATACLGLHH